MYCKVYSVWFQMYKDLTNRYESAKKAQSEMRQDVHNLRKVYSCKLQLDFPSGCNWKTFCQHQNWLTLILQVYMFLIPFYFLINTRVFGFFWKGDFCSSYGYFDCNLKFFIMSHSPSYRDNLSGYKVYAMSFLKLHGYY